ncbi:MAG TPA: single-stranded DNA-binding protein [Flavobacteriales bacterium]|nr:single-stranded DNA-binding protein [Flavobacteriales bacterium]
METTLRNRVQLMGNLGRDPEVKELEGGKRMARFSVATNERFTFANGETKDDTQWHAVVAWGRTAEKVAQELRKGSRISLEGRLVHRTYEAKDGKKRYVTEVVLLNFEVVVPQPEAMPA